MDNNEEQKKSFRSGMLVGAFAGSALGLVICIIGFVIITNRYNNLYESENKNKHQTTVSENAENNDENKKIKDKLLTDDVIYKMEKMYKLIVDEFYFEEDIDTELMRDNMYKAIVDSLGDKYSVYYTEKEFNALLESSQGSYYGIGSYVTMDEDKNLPMLSGIFDASPAKDAGLHEGDFIYKVEGEEISGLTLDEVVALIKGPEGTKVHLSVLRNDEILEVDVFRGAVTVPTVSYELKDGGVGYIQITEFDDVTTEQFKNAYDDLKSKNIKGLVIDLRSNPGGNLDTVLSICGELLPEGLITYTEDKYGKREEFRCAGDNKIEIPLAVLVNGYSASASELMSGAIKDYKVGTLIGTNTFGKGIVQSFKYLDTFDGTGIKYTSSRYYTPNGICIHGTGIAPDITVEFDGEAYYTENPEDSVDNQLEYALDYIRKQIK